VDGIVVSGGDAAHSGSEEGSLGSRRTDSDGVVVGGCALAGDVASEVRAVQAGTPLRSPGHRAIYHGTPAVITASLVSFMPHICVNLGPGQTGRNWASCGGRLMTRTESCKWAAIFATFRLLHAAAEAQALLWTRRHRGRSPAATRRLRQTFLYGFVYSKVSRR
jgi:hypothetical protein